MFIMVNKKIGKNDTNVIKWMFTVCKKQFPMMILLVVLNAIYGISSVFFAKFSKSIIDGATPVSYTHLTLPTKF